MVTDEHSCTLPTGSRDTCVACRNGPQCDGRCLVTKDSEPYTHNTTCPKYAPRRQNSEYDSRKASAQEIRALCEKLPPHCDYAGEIVERIASILLAREAPLNARITELETALRTVTRCGLPVTSGNPDDGNAETGWLCALPKGHDGQCDTDGTA